MVNKNIVIGELTPMQEFEEAFDLATSHEEKEKIEKWKKSCTIELTKQKHKNMLEIIEATLPCYPKMRYCPKEETFKQYKLFGIPIFIDKTLAPGEFLLLNS